jgi:alkylhydroperoxidase family enzyme
MLRALILRKLSSEERKLGASLDYVRHMVRNARLGAFFRFARFLPLAAYRRVLPAPACHVARLAAVRHADCGTCLQIEVRAARKDGVPAEVVAAAARGDPVSLPDDLADVHRFATAVVAASGGEDALRETLRARYGEEGLVELALAVASCRVFPEVKRALGFARSCSLVPLEIP